MSSIGYKDIAKIYTLEDKLIQVIKCKANDKKITSSGFLGSGKISQGQTLSIKTKDKINKTKCQAGLTRCLYNGNYYLITGYSELDVSAINNRNRPIIETILFLQ